MKTPRHPLLLFLPVQAALLLWRLDLLPLWGDEYATLHRAGLATADLLAELRLNVHPPLYFLLAREWLHLPLPFGPVVRLRALSVLCALLATVVIDRAWLARASRAARCWFLALWTLSPCLLLYARMGRSYSLQLLLSCIALHAAWRLLRRPRHLGALLAYTAAVAALLATHYLPATAIVAAVGAFALLKLVRQRDASFLLPLAVPATVLSLVVQPWLASAVAAFHGVAAASPARVAPGVPAALPALLYTAVAFGFGEVFPPWVIAGAALVAPLLGALVLRGLRLPTADGVLVLAVSLIAFAGAIKWVSAPFVAARLLFLLPAFLWWLVRMGENGRGLGRIALAGLLGFSLLSDVAYFRGEGFLNTAYVLPYPSIAETISRGSPAGGALVFLDHQRVNLEALRYYLPPGFEVALLADDAAEREMWGAIKRVRPPVAWILRSTAPAAEDRPAQGYTMRRRFFGRYTRLERLLIRLAGRADPPTHALELLELRTPGT